MVNPVFIGMVYELIIIIIGAILLVLILNKYSVKRNRPTLYLFVIYLNLVMAIVFSWFSKIIVLTTDLDYVYNQPGIRYPTSPVEWLFFRIIDFRISIVFAAIGVIFSYLLNIEIFQEFNPIHRILVFLFGAYSIIFAIFVYERGNTLLDAINFMNILVFLAAIYITFTNRLIKAYKESTESIYKNAFLSLAIMSISFILTFIFVLIDRITIIMGSQGFTFFYFLAWSFVIIGFLGAYLGYVRPKASES
ncbi:MAG: hypothetical protein EU539_06230 [Promethearchaeota archaeon]|nr:MAG: hypothetical protein EU539_06230 [Candidatus Lokiarchaeota archaeon]